MGDFYYSNLIFNVDDRTEADICDFEIQFIHQMTIRSDCKKINFGYFTLIIDFFLTRLITLTLGQGSNLSRFLCVENRVLLQNDIKNDVHINSQF